MNRDPFERYAPRRPVYQPETEPEAEEAGEEESPGRYRAFSLHAQGKSATRLKLTDQRGTIWLVAYAYLTEVICASPQYVSLVFAHYVFTLHGRNLTPLIDLLQEDKIKALRCYLEHEYQEPPAANELVILEMKRESRESAATR